MGKESFFHWGSCPQTPGIFRFTARMDGGRIDALERRVELSRNGTRAPTQGRNSSGRLRPPTQIRPADLNLSKAKNGLDNRDLLSFFLTKSIKFRAGIGST
jgi:hypothetical protein